MSNTSISTLINGTSEATMTINREAVARNLARGTFDSAIATLDGKVQKIGLFIRIFRGVQVAEDHLQGGKSQGEAGEAHGFSAGEAKHGLALGCAYGLGASDATLLRFASTVRKSGAEYRPEKDYVIKAAKGKHVFSESELVRLMDVADAYVKPEADPKSQADKIRQAYATIASLMAADDQDGSIDREAAALSDEAAKIEAALRYRAVDTVAALADVA